MHGNTQASDARFARAFARFDRDDFRIVHSVIRNVARPPSARKPDLFGLIPRRRPLAPANFALGSLVAAATLTLYPLRSGSSSFSLLVAAATRLGFASAVCWPPRRSARLLSRDGSTDTTEPQIFVFDAGIEDIAVGRAGIPSAAGPTAAPAHPSLVAAQSRPRRVLRGRSRIVAQ